MQPEVYSHETTLLKHSGTSPKTLRRASGTVVVTLLCAVGTFTATPASAAPWTGTVHGRRVTSNGLVTGGFSWQGSFSFTTNREGAVHGRAIVGYQPLWDLTVLNNAVTYARDVATDFVNVLPGAWGPAINALGTRQLVGTSVQFSESMGVRQGPISGRLNRNGRKLNLRWKGNREPTGIEYGIYLRSATQGSKRIGTDVASLPNPFTEQVGDLVNGHHAVSVHSPTPAQSDTPRYDSYWVADRMG